MELTKIEISLCIEAVTEARDTMRQKLADGVYVHDTTGEMKDLADQHDQLISKLWEIWKEMPVENLIDLDNPVGPISKYPCDGPDGKCPHSDDPHGMYFCRDHCGLGVDENEEDISDRFEEEVE